MLAVEVANIQTGVWERRDGRWCESRAWRFVDVDDLIFQPLVNKRGKAVLPAQD